VNKASALGVHVLCHFRPGGSLSIVTRLIRLNLFPPGWCLNNKISYLLFCVATAPATTRPHFYFIFLGDGDAASAKPRGRRLTHQHVDHLTTFHLFFPLSIYIVESAYKAFSICGSCDALALVCMYTIWSIMHKIKFFLSIPFFLSCSRFRHCVLVAGGASFNSR
jgi:hypothetical protein